MRKKQILAGLSEVCMGMSEVSLGMSVVCTGMLEYNRIYPYPEGVLVRKKPI